MYDEVKVLEHSSIKITGEKVIYFDPYHVEDEMHDADYIFITHEHYDHYSPEDIEKVKKEGTILVMPESMGGQEKKAGFLMKNVIMLWPGERKRAEGIEIEAVAAYNNMKPFHTKDKKWLGYVVAMGGTRYYVAGDTDPNEENKKVSCDVAIVPVGGTYTMNHKDAAKFINEIKPKMAIPSHYGSIVGTVGDAQKFIQLVDAGIEARR